MHTYYAARANEYDSIYRKPERQADLRLIESWLPAQFLGKQVLEVACGTGYWTQFIAPCASRLVALDAAAETIRIAETRVPRDKVDFVVGDAYALPSGLGRFDAAFAGFWFSHVPKSRRQQFLAGLGRVLEPGASVVLLDNSFVQGSSSPISELDDEGNTFQMRVLNDGTQHRVLKNFLTEQELRAAIAGLGVAGKFHQWSYFWAFEYVAARP
jgi:ubiquinone/menaquinone biosynthesis C-methylase UbiE